MALAHLENVTFNYAYAPTPALQDVNLTLEPGLIYGLVGQNGAGKTSLCNLLRSLIPHFYDGELTGQVSILGKPRAHWDPAELSRRIGFVFQNPFTQISGIRSSVFEEIALGLENLGAERADMIERVVQVSAKLGIVNLLEKNPNSLSGGQRQKVAFAAILAMDSDFMIIDEPTSQLDPQSSHDIFTIIEGLRERGTSILLVEHKVDLLAEFTDRLVVMDAGTVTAVGPTGEIVNSPALEHAFVPKPEVVQLADLLAQARKPLPRVPVSASEATALLRERTDGAITRDDDDVEEQHEHQA